MKLANPPKAWILGLGILGLIILMALGRVDSAAGLPVLTALCGYGVGNGIAAASGTPAEPILAPDPNRKKAKP